MIEKELLNKYRETISLLEFRKPGYIFEGSFLQDNGKFAFELAMYKFDSEGEWGGGVVRNFKFFDTQSDAFKYFITVSQNRVY